MMTALHLPGRISDEIFCHHIYEYRKGLRNLILHTMNIQNRDAVM